MQRDSLLTGENATFLDAEYRRWLLDPESVEPEWRALFEEWDRPATVDGVASVPQFQPRSIFDPGGTAAPAADMLAAERVQARVAQFINAYRVRGHLWADVDPLDRAERIEHPELTLKYYGFTETDLDRQVYSTPLFGVPEICTLREIVARCRAAYSGFVGAEFMNIHDLGQKLWVAEQLETLPDKEVLDAQQVRHVLRKLADAENFERLLHQKFPGSKRFSLEGAETLIPLLDVVIEKAGEHGVKEVVFGMAHRGRLNVLVNTLQKPVSIVVDEFSGVFAESVQGSGDVKYHLGYSHDHVTTSGNRLHLSLAFNPSHLEAVDPVVEGRVRAKQDRFGDAKNQRALPILIHGDAAFAGQGVVAEVLQMSELDGYKTGGTIHIILNNQIGFTTLPKEGRSTVYATDIARMLGIPIFHVNGEDPRSVTAVVQMAMEWRGKYRRDVVIDMLCYRKHGHNEGDEPAFTQPGLYEEIRRRPSPLTVYTDHCVQLGVLGREEVDAIVARSRQAMEDQIAARSEIRPSGKVGDRSMTTKVEHDDLRFLLRREQDAATLDNRRRLGAGSLLKGIWERYLHGSIHDEVETRVPKQRLADLVVQANTLPDWFHPHPKIERLLAQRLEMADGRRPIDWAVGEQLAYATLVTEGWRVRLAGQDSGRGTFSHRHAVLTDVKDNTEFYPLQHLAPDQAGFVCLDSFLSEYAALGFEFGYALDYPDALVLWEAQFGDFANGAQVIIDQFITSAEQKWARLTGIVMLLPHGYEGQGPEHSSARLERFLQLAAQDNIQIANCTTPANFFHLLRRQTIRHVRKPLIVFTPKSLLRHPLVVSTLDDLAEGHFQHVIGEADPLDPGGVRRVVFCSGKVYYELLEERRRRGEERVALVRVELLYPYPRAAIDAELAKYPADAEVVWCQEEPRNMGAWPFYFHWMHEHLTASRMPRYVGRPVSASPATGHAAVSKREQDTLIKVALELPETP